MYTVYFIFFQVASATATRFGLSRGLLGLQYDQINESESESESESLKLPGSQQERPLRGHGNQIYLIANPATTITKSTYHE